MTTPTLPEGDRGISPKLLPVYRFAVIFLPLEAADEVAQRAAASATTSGTEQR